MCRLIVATALACGIVAAAWTLNAGWSETAALAQAGKTTSRSKSPKSGQKPDVKPIDVRAQRMLEAYVREAVEVARDYGNAGEFGKSKAVLESILELTPDLPAVKQQITVMENAILTGNEFEIEVDAAKNWDLPRARVFKGKTFRIRASGNYRFVANLQVGPQGFPAKDPSTDMADTVPCGALMGLIVEPGKKKPGKPFAVGKGTDYTPKENGALFLRVNVPPNHKCTGRIKVKLSGLIPPG